MRKQTSIDACSGRTNAACASGSRVWRRGVARIWFACAFVPLAWFSPAYGDAQTNDSGHVTSALTKAADKTGAALKRGAQAVGPAIDTGVSKTEKGIKKGISFVGREFERAGKKLRGEYESHIDNVDPNQKPKANSSARPSGPPV